MTWTLTADGKTVTITDTDADMVQEKLDHLGSAGTHFEYTADDGTELSIDSNSSVTLTRDR
ncbi:MAG: hypothetical protein ABIQ01_07530 [Pseudolysinimonas sp.]